MSNRTNQNRRKLAAIKRAAQAKSAVSMLDFANSARALLDKYRGSHPSGLLTVTCEYRSWSGSNPRIEKPSFRINAAGNGYNGGIVDADTPREALRILNEKLSVPPAPQVAEFDTKAELPW